MEKVILPIKTKIAASWLKIMGIIVVIFLIIYYVFQGDQFSDTSSLVQFFAFLCGLALEFLIFIPSFLPDTWLWGFLYIGVIGTLLVLTSYYISKKKRWALVLYFVSFSILAIIPIYDLVSGIVNPKIATSPEFYLLHLFFLYTPFVLLLLDRKNFWKISS